MRLHLGCGAKRLDGFVNVDKWAGGAADEVVDLEATPWPWATDSVDEIVAEHVLEHLGQTAEQYLSVWTELYRVLAPGGLLRFTVPHWLHHCFDHDPTHVRKVTPIGVLMFDQTRNRQVLAAGGAETPLGLQLGIDFETLSCEHEYEAWYLATPAGKFAEPRRYDTAIRNNSAVIQTHYVVRAHKPGRG